ncbi:MAG: ABC transporter ATP-binding protein/permease, partial [Lachnospiraceae bacterium]|nr:ABC transporter ATP-binding protein/permease [Lachnospiraceae bacterium]
MDIIRKLRAVLNKKQKRQVVLLLFMISIGAVLETLGVSMILPLVTAVVEPDVFTGNRYVVLVSRALGLENIEQFVLVMIAALILIFILKNAYLLLMYYAQHTFIANSQFNISRELLKIYFNKPYEFYLNANTSDVLRTVYSDTTGVFSLLLECIQFLSEFVIALCLGAVLLIIDFQMTVAICALLFGVTALITIWFKPKMGQIGQEARIRQSRMYNSIIQSIMSIKDVKIFAKEESFLEEYENNGRKFYNLSRSQKVLGSVPRLVIETVCIGGVLAYMGAMIMTGRSVTNMLPQLSAFALAAMRLMPSANRMSTYLANIAYYKPTLDYVYENVEMPQNVKQVETPKTIGRQTGEKLPIEESIQVTDLTYRYPNSEKLIFDHAQMEVPVGKSVGIVGKSGAGKTTLVDIILGLLDAETGEILCDGKDVLSNYAGWLHNIGYIPQSINLMDDTIRANVAFGIPREKIDEKRVWEVIDEAQLRSFVEGLPEGLDTEIGERGIRMSGGQRQRLGIARALYHNPELLILDEATSA